MTYGALVAQMLQDYENVQETNRQLFRVGHNIGVRVVEEVLARTGLGRCADFKDTMEAVARVGFKMFMGICPTIANWSADGKECRLVLEENPLVEYVHLPEHAKDLVYCNVFCGIIKGALEMIQLEVEAVYLSSTLQGAAHDEIAVRLLRVLEDERPPGDE